MTDVVMLQMGESIVEGTLTKWLKKPGERVERVEDRRGEHDAGARACQPVPPGAGHAAGASHALPRNERYGFGLAPSFGFNIGKVTMLLM